MKELDAGKLYQVYYNKEWRIAEYDKTVAAHSYKYNNIDMNTLRCGPQRTANVPEQARFKTVSAMLPGHDEYRSAFHVDTRGIQVRDVTPEAAEEIERMKERIRELQKQERTARKELKEFCGYQGL